MSRKEYNLVKLFPSFLTMMGIALGLSSIRFALDDKWELAVLMVLIAALIDGMDGTLARALNATSNFGAQLDSLSDFINFGFVPVFVIYLWSLHSVPKLGWAAVLFYTICCAVRLARFNTELEDDDDDDNNIELSQDEQKENEAKAFLRKKYFTGVPSPAGALACLAPLMAFLSIKDPENPSETASYILELLQMPAILIAYTSFIGFLMASKFHSFSPKVIIIKRKILSPIIIAIVAVIVFTIINPWLTVLVCIMMYYSTIPVSVYQYKRDKKRLL